MTWHLAAPAGKLGAFLLAFLVIDLRAPVQVSPSAAVLEARAQAAARRERTVVSAQACRPDPIENRAPVRVAFTLHSADLTEAGRTALSEAAARLACAPAMAARVVSLGEPHRLAGYRRDVAERRADVIAAYFRGDGVVEGRVVRAPAEAESTVQTEGAIVIEAVGPDA